MLLPHLSKPDPLSLFQRLCGLHPDSAVCELGIQYRMCSDVMLLANTLVYKNKLRCADERTARSTLQARTLEGVPPFVRRFVLP